MRFVVFLDIDGVVNTNSQFCRNGMSRDKKEKSKDILQKTVVTSIGKLMIE